MTIDISIDVLIGVETLCEKLDVSRNTLDRWRRNYVKNVEPNFPEPCCYVGSSPRWRLTVVNDWINKGKL